MRFADKYLKSIYISNRFLWLWGLCIIIYMVSFVLPLLYTIANVLFYGLLVLIAADYMILFFFTRRPEGQRIIQDRLSNGDENKVELELYNPNSFALRTEIIDELPEQLQERDFTIFKTLPANKYSRLKYVIRPVNRGEYSFGDIQVFISTILHLVKRRVTIEADKTVRVYPSFVDLKNQKLSSNTSLVVGGASRRVRRVGQSMEFEQIKDYVIGDDIRSINWKATARRNGLMVNSYTDEKSQQILAIIDKGRLMKMPFNRLSLLDYAINSALALSNFCLQKQDKFGLVTFDERKATIISPDRSPLQKEKIMNALYSQQTIFSESDHEMLYMQIRHKIKQRSLLILFTNFESLNGLYRQLPYLRSIAKHHLLVTIFFENTELTSLAAEKVDNVDDIYVKTIAEKLSYEKKLIVKELQKYGIMSVLTTPQGLTANTLNKYLEIKERQLI